MSDRGRPDTGLFEELKALTDASLRGEINAAQVARLEHLLRDRAAMDLYLELVWESYILATWAKSSELEELAIAPMRSIPRQAPAGRGSPMRGFSRRMTRPLRRYRGDPRFALAMVWIATLLFAGAVAGVVAAITVMWRGANLPGDQQIAEHGPAQPPTPAGPVARLIRVSDCVWSGETKSPAVGDELVASRKLTLKTGLAEVVFGNGAHAIVEGPAVFEVSTRASARLSRGKCAVTAEGASARGFAIHAPGMNYTDLGTEFGVLVAESGVQEMHVFRGRVQAEQGREQGAGSREQGAESKEKITGGAHSVLPAPRSPLIVSAHEAIRVAAPDPSGKPSKPIQLIAADEKRFVRVILDPFPIFGTGVGLNRGEADTHWQITAVSTIPTFKPRPAVVTDQGRFFTRGSKTTGQFVSDAADPTGQPDGCRWTLRTEFDLSGFDPDTASIAGRFSVDDFLIDVRLNGKPVPVATRGNVETMSPLRIEKGFIAGKNVLEIVIENSRPPPGSRHDPNCMGLCVQWQGTGRKLTIGD